MKIAQICPYDMDRPGGVQAHIRDLGTALIGLGHEVVILAPQLGTADPVSPATALSPEIHRLGRARRIGFGGTAYEISIALGAEAQRLRALVENGHFDVIHYHTMWTPLLPFQVFRHSKTANIATFHDTPAPNWEGRLLAHAFRAMSRTLLPRLDGVITPSEAPQGHLVKTGPPITILPPCTNLARFANGTPARTSRYADRRLNILFLGRLEARKGAGLLLEAFSRLSGSGLNLRLLIAGSGEMEGQLRAFAAEQQLAHVEFLGGFSDEQAPQLYADCDIFCAPAPYGESFGIVLAEAMASGKPVVAAANEGYRSLLTGEGAAFLTPPGDCAALADALATLARDALLRARLGAWGREHALGFDARVLAPKFVALYEEGIRRFNARKAI